MAARKMARATLTLKAKISLAGASIIVAVEDNGFNRCG